MVQRMTNLLGVAGIVLISTLWTAAANAGCAKINGVYMCASWITGSQDLNATITGLGNVKDNCAAGACPLVSATVFGTVPPYAGAQCKPSLQSDGTWTQEPRCAIEGMLYCINPAGNASKAQGQPFSLNATLSESALLESRDCSKNGKCTTEVPVEGNLSQLSNYCINPNWIAVAFTASRFYGVSELDYFDNKGLLQHIDILDLCSATLPASYKPGQMYSCPTPLP